MVYCLRSFIATQNTRDEVTRSQFFFFIHTFIYNVSLLSLKIPIRQTKGLISSCKTWNTRVISTISTFILPFSAISPLIHSFKPGLESPADENQTQSCLDENNIFCSYGCWMLTGRKEANQRLEKE